MTSLQELLEQKKALELQIERVLKAERDGALSQARHLVETYKLTVEDLFGKQKASGKTAAIKYHNHETGESWSGRGRAPRWLDGKNREDFAV